MSKYIYADNIYDKDPWKTWKNISIDGKDMDTSSSSNNSSNSKNGSNNSSNSSITKSSKNIEITQPLSVLPRTNVTPTTADLNKVLIEKIH